MIGAELPVVILDGRLHGFAVKLDLNLVVAELRSSCQVVNDLDATNLTAKVLAAMRPDFNCRYQHLGGFGFEGILISTEALKRSGSFPL